MELTNLASLKLMHWKILKRYKQNPDDIFRKVASIRILCIPLAAGILNGKVLLFGRR